MPTLAPGVPGPGKTCSPWKGWKGPGSTMRDEETLRKIKIAEGPKEVIFPNGVRVPGWGWATH